MARSSGDKERCGYQRREKAVSVDSITSSIRKWKRATVPVAALALLVALGPRAAWPQQPAQAPLDDEMAKQEKIYQSRGGDVPRGYITDRGLSAYAELLPSGFCPALGRLGSSERWLDIGAGEGQAMLDYYDLEDDEGPAKKCAASIDKARAVAISIEDRQTEAWKQMAAIFGQDRLRYLPGKRLREYSDEELGKFQVITDVFGGFTYTEDLSRFIGKVLGLLEVGGAFYGLLPGVHLEDGKDRLGASILTELQDADGRPENACSWLKRIGCVQVSCESKSDSNWKRPTELVSIRKVCSDVTVPRMKLVKFVAGYPPDRRFQLEQ
jgi:SAM-dependent methyltransferase